MCAPSPSIGMNQSNRACDLSLMTESLPRFAAPARSGPARAGQVGLPPELEHQEDPQRPAMVAVTGDMLRHEPPHRFGSEEPDPAHPFGRKGLLEQRSQGATQPLGDRDAEALFPPSDDRVGQPPGQGALQHVLRGPAPELHRRRHGASQLDERRIEEWSTRLHAARHRAAVHLHQRLPGEIELAVMVDRAADGIARGRARHDLGDVPGGIERGAGLANLRRDQVTARGWREAAHHDLDGDVRGVLRAAKELLEEEARAPVAVRGRQSVEEPRRSPEGPARQAARPSGERRDRKSTRLNSSHLVISYAVFCLKKKKTLNFHTYRYTYSRKRHSAGPTRRSRPS